MPSKEHVDLGYLQCLLLEDVHTITSRLYRDNDYTDTLLPGEAVYE
jgi:hypothetical protein